MYHTNIIKYLHVYTACIEFKYLYIYTMCIKLKHSYIYATYTVLNLNTLYLYVYTTCMHVESVNLIYRIRFSEHRYFF